MSKEKYTPGPWHVGAQNDMLYVIDEPARPSNDDINPDVDIAAIAKVYRPREGTFDVEQANANLIAAAPELLASLELAIYHAGATDEWLYQAREVISKAKGGPCRQLCPSCGEPVQSIFDHVDQDCEAA